MAPIDGTIKTLTGKGFGFIEADGQEYVFHQSACVGVRIDELRELTTERLFAVRSLKANNDPMTIARLFLVRHGATASTEEDRFSGSSGAELSEQGRWQASSRRSPFRIVSTRVCGGESCHRHQSVRRPA